ncbi:MAG: flotillin family protein [Oscillospiraceae bacterium]|nr:flotillin family protein [Oscillospiraceae bacterium]
MLGLVYTGAAIGGLPISGGTIAGIIAVVLIIIVLASGYVKAPPDKAFIISGLGKRAKVVIGKAAIKIPFFERLDKLDLGLMPVDVKTASAVPTADYINISVDGIVNVKVSLTDSGLALAQQNFLNKDRKYIVSVAREVLEGNMREIVGTMELREMVSNRQKFADKVKENASPDLANMGLEIVSFNVQNFTDSQGVIDNLGIDNISKIQKDASIARANADRDVAVARAEANKQANDARVAADLEIAMKNNDLSIKQAELKKASDIKQAEADAAYKIQEEEQRKQIEITTADANIARQEKEVELETQRIAIQERKLDAEVRKQAEARKFEQQQKADAFLYTRQREVEAKKFEDIQSAEAELAVKQREADAAYYAAEQDAKAQRAKAEAAKYAAEQEAEGIKAKGLAEAEAVKAKALAEAEGLNKKAEAMQKMQEAAILQMYFEKLPEIAKAVAEPLTNIDSITMYGDGNTTKLVSDITQSTTQISSGLLDGMGISLQDLLSSVLTGKAIATGINSTEDKKPGNVTIIHNNENGATQETF